MDFSKSSNSRSIHWAWAWASPHWETEGRLESASLAENPLCELVLLQHNYKNSVIYGTQVQSLPCLVTPSVTFCPFWFSSMLVNVILKVVQWICQNLYIDFYELLHGFVKVVTWICQSCSTYFSPLAKQNHTEVWPRFQSLLKLLLWTTGVKWIKVLNALGLLCLW